MPTARLTTIDLPRFGRSAVAPELPAAVYPARVERVRQRAAERGCDWVVVYADREHSANLAYLTGFDPRFEAVAEWYGALRVGQSGGALQEIIDRRLADPFFGIFLNPGHQLHLDEWVNSPIYPGSRVELRSGMVMQVDILPATGGPYFTTNVEDGIALADAALRATLAATFPDLWERVGRRRAFMRDALGIDLHPDVLPLSNSPAVLAPFLLRPDRAMALPR